MTQKELITIASYPNRNDAEIAKGLLESNGIRAFIAADDGGGMYPSLSIITGGAKLRVKIEDKKQASELLR